MKKSVGLVYKHSLDESNLQKASTIYESMINQKEEDEVYPDEEQFSK